MTTGARQTRATPRRSGLTVPFSFLQSPCFLFIVSPLFILLLLRKREGK